MRIVALIAASAAALAVAACQPAAEEAPAATPPLPKPLRLPKVPWLRKPLRPLLRLPRPSNRFFWRGAVLQDRLRKGVVFDDPLFRAPSPPERRSFTLILACRLP